MARSAPILAARLRLEPFAGVHLTQRYVDWLNDPAVVRFSAQRHRRHTLASCRAYQASFEDSPNYSWAVVALDPALGHVGNMNAYVDRDDGVADVGILIGERSVWGQGYGLEAWRAACAYLLGEAGLRKVSAGALETNTAMLAIMRRAGMVADGRRLRHRLFEGRAVDVVHAALFAPVTDTAADAANAGSLRGTP